jgi:hypothetical protein
MFNKLKLIIIMTVVETFDFTKEFYNLEITYQNICTTHCILSFQLEVSKSIKILSNLLRIVRNKKNIFSDIPADLLGCVFSFLPKKYIISNFSICKKWNDMLIRYSKMKLFSNLPTNLHLENNLLVRREYLRDITSNDNYIFVLSCNHIDYYDNNLRLVSTINADVMLIAANNEYLLCYYPKCAKLYSLSEKKFVEKFKLEYFISGLTMCSKYIYFVSGKKIYIYNFDGHLLKTWELNINKTFYSHTNISVNNDEIFLTIPNLFDVSVFSSNGKLLRKICCNNHCLGEKYKPNNVLVSNNTIYLTTFGQILVFDYFGNFLFYVKSNSYTNLITLLNNNLYISGTDCESIRIYRPIYDGA